jgi:hypothetical protein
MMRPSLLFAGGASVLVIGFVAVALLIVPPPWEQRKRNLDQQRVQDLAAISNAVEQYRRANGSMPPGLDALLPTRRFPPLHLADPTTSVPYEYITEGDRNYKLCATFDTETSESDMGSWYGAADWRHERGRQCFSLSLPARPTNSSGRNRTTL